MKSGLSRGRAAASLLPFLLLAGSCTSRAPDVGSRRGGLGSATLVAPASILPLDKGLARLPAENAQDVLGFKGTVPPQAPAYAVAFSPGLTGLFQPSGKPAVLPLNAGHVSTLAYVADVGRTPIHVRLLCVADGEQRACAPNASVWDMALTGDTIGLARVNIAATAGIRLDVLLDIFGDGTRPYPTSTDLYAYVGETKGQFTGQPVPVTKRFYGGCNFAELTNTLQGPRPVHRWVRNRPLYMLVQTCANNAFSLVVRALLVVNDSQVIAVQRVGWSSPVEIVADRAWSGTVPIADGYNRIQVWVLLLGHHLHGFWITHPVDLST